MSNLSARLKRLWETFQAVWDESFVRSDREPTGFRKFLHFWVLVWRSFVRNRCPVRASALSFTTLLALIPMLAVAMSVSSMFLKDTGEQQIETFIEEFVNRLIPQFDPSATNVLLTEPEMAADTDELAGEDLTDTNGAPVVESTNTVTEAFKEAVSTAKTNVADDATESPDAVAASTESPPPIRDERVRAAQRDFAQYIHGFIQNTNGGALGATGMFFLFITVILTLARIEETFNDIWGVSHGRDWFTRIKNYVVAIVFGPALIGLALTLASSPRLERTRDLLAGMPLVEVVIGTILPSAVICFSFTLFYKLMPNTKVHFSAAFMGGALAGTLWQVYNLLGFLLASRALNASKIYGSFAMIPLFMGGLYIVWLTVLFGAQVAYAFQNREAYLQEKLVENVNQRGREFVALRLMTCIGQRYQRGLPMATVPEMSSELGIPSRLIQQVLHVLLSARLVIEVARGEPAYAPARPLEQITAHHVLMAMRATQGQELVTRDEPVRAEVLGEFARIQAAEKEAASAITMLTLVNRAQSRLELAPPEPDEEPRLTPAFVPPTSTVEAVNTTEPEPEPEPQAPSIQPKAEKIASVEIPIESNLPEEKRQSKREVQAPSDEDDRGFPL